MAAKCGEIREKRHLKLQLQQQQWQVASGSSVHCVLHAETLAQSCFGHGQMPLGQLSRPSRLSFSRSLNELQAAEDAGELEWITVKAYLKTYAESGNKYCIWIKLNSLALCIFMFKGKYIKFCLILSALKSMLYFFSMCPAHWSWLRNLFYIL